MPSMAAVGAALQHHLKRLLPRTSRREELRRACDRIHLVVWPDGFAIHTDDGIVHTHALAMCQAAVVDGIDDDVTRMREC